MNSWPSQTLHFLSSKTHQETQQNQARIKLKTQLETYPVQRLAANLGTFLVSFILTPKSTYSASKFLYQVLLHVS